MELQTIVGYAGALVIGVVLGLVGGGGSILTVPVLVYLLAVEPVLATAYSLFVVGFAASIGAIQNFRKGMVDVKTGIVFAIPALIAVFLTRLYLIPAIPEELFQLGDLVVTKDIGIMVFFALIMLFASISMIRGRKGGEGEEGPVVYNYPMIVLEGAVVGVLTGIVGAGGGFLIIPALVIFAKLPMKKAVGTSLLIIAAKSLIGFVGDVQNMAIDWSFLLVFAGITAVGILVGIYLTNFIEGKKLKKGFGWFVLLMGVYILWKELS
ncbi:MAG: sulfite exporter TauE/SafE family protein [Flavobacteriales bacterium]|nr:sulfite exporter TauE/SafE family protein [Flavobacteriales bacterium]MDG1781428.1 sulfite exporter TauE/SafE family protein [Flavobacteriales bacterium]MDG2245454.1 sulfite exporter TauE/SafE family protein [Flavobacteriales bacterium]